MESRGGMHNHDSNRVDSSQVPFLMVKLDIIVIAPIFLEFSV